MPTEPAMHEIEIPAPDPGAVKPWRKSLTGVDGTQRGGYAVQGPFLDAGAVYRLPVGALVVGVDRSPESPHRVRLWRVTRDGALKTERDSQFKTREAEFGAGMLKTLATALTKHPAGTGSLYPRFLRPAAPAAAEAEQPNRLDDRCRHCGQAVPAGAGLLKGRPGNRWVEHRPGACPPARNQLGQVCADCGGWVEAGTGVLSSPHQGVWEVRHDGACPPKESAGWAAPPPAPRRRNRLADQCVRCEQDVAEGAGWLIPPAFEGGHYTVEHETCPPSPAEGHRTWRISAGVPGRFDPRPTGGLWGIGHVARFEVYADGDNPVPEDAPGRRVGRYDSRVSLIGTVVAEGRPVYCRDENGDAPCDELIGEDGWYYTGRIRAASPEEAAPLLAEEAEAAIDRELAARVRSLLTWRYPRTEHGVRYLPEAELAEELADAELVEVRTRPRGSGPSLDLYPDQVWIAAGRDWVMTTAHNGQDGDDWSRINLWRHIALLHPMTDELRRLVDDLTARYGTVAPQRPAEPPADAESTPDDEIPGTYADVRPGTRFTTADGEQYIAVDHSVPYGERLGLSIIGLDDGRSARTRDSVLQLGNLPILDGQFIGGADGLPAATAPITIHEHGTAYDHHVHHAGRGGNPGRCAARDELLRTTTVLRDNEQRSPRMRNAAVRNALREGLDVAEIREITALTEAEIEAIRDAAR
ncbi:hypothetical protein ACFV1L_21910 [Kitasatospora sp. NPDC059646]|uniref:hypothetical protein n=1 Tax=Kitasatospora sp. NPDC059646 TaxID=3346893 RepID=UPI003686C856